MTRDEILMLASEIQDSMNNLPNREDINWNPKYNDGYREATINAVQKLLDKVKDIDNAS